MDLEDASSKPKSEPRHIVVGEDDDEGPDPMIGQVLSGLYKVESRIGQGGMGTVYMALHIHLDKPFAVKVLGEQIASNRAAMHRLLQEARTASSIDHDNIVDVINFDTTEDGRVFLVMELLEGVSLADLVEKGPMRLDRAIPIARQVCHALEAAHARGIVHRDLKPENVFICRKHDADFVKVLDFGISKVRTAEAEAVRVTKTGQLLGTPLYMSPEQARGETDVDHRADVYALGVMLFEMLTGRPPFEGSNYFQLLWKHGNEPPPSALSFQPDLPPALDAVLMRALAKTPDARFQSMQAFEEALLAATPGLETPARLVSMPPLRPSAPTPSEARATPVALAQPAPAQPAPAEPGAVQPTAAPSAPSRQLLALGGLAVAALLGALGYVVLRAPAETPVATAAAPSIMPSDVPAPVAPPDPPIPAEPEPVPEGAALPNLVDVRFASSPSGAAVVVGDTELGRTPLTHPLEAGSPVEVHFRLSGYAPERVLVTPREGTELSPRLTPRRRPTTPTTDDLPIRMSL